MPIPTRKIIKSDLAYLLSASGPLDTSAVYSSLAEKWSLTDEEIDVKRSGGALYQNEIRWARQELAIEGVIARPTESARGIWKLKDGLLLSDQDERTEFAESDTYPEGTVKKLYVNAYERSAQARKDCVEHYGCKCIVCNFDFESAYGAIGKDRIHVHHLVEISSIGDEYRVNPKHDLVPICPNCHYIAHQRRPAFTIQEMKAMLFANVKKHANKGT